MADDLTTSVKEELCRVEVKSQNVRIAEIAAMIRFAGECSDDCVYCPCDLRMPKSYLWSEPACL